jgi:hypothetical protein
MALIALAQGLGCTGTLGGLPEGSGARSGSDQGGRGGASSGSGDGGAGGGVGTGAGTGGAMVNPGTGGMSIAQLCAMSNGALNTGTSRARRLTRAQYFNTVRDLLRMPAAPASSPFELDDERIGPFHSNAIAPVDLTAVSQLQASAAELATGAVTRMAQISPCDLTAADAGNTCATRFVTELGRKAFRRPLGSEEIQSYLGLYTLGRTGDGPANGFRLVVETLLQSPFFLYHQDLGMAATPQTTPVRLTPYELASRLSYFLWNTMPDDTLFTAAANGTLNDDAPLRAEVERMLNPNEPRAGVAIGMFHRQWLDLDKLPNKVKSATIYPRYSPQVAAAMLRETELFSDYVIRRGDGLLKTLLTSPMVFPQGELFSIYGASQPANYVTGTPVNLDPTRRAGLLTQAAFLAGHSYPDQSSPVHRGIVVRERVLCGTIKELPPGFTPIVPEPTPNETTRERFARHVAVEPCAGCHLAFDPIGIGFEHYDALGGYRTSDGTGAVDARSTLAYVGPDLAGPFDGAVELASKLAGSEEVANCMADQWFRFSLGRMESNDDACSIQAIRQGFRASNGNIRTLMAEIAVSPAFRHVRSNGN